MNISKQEKRSEAKLVEPQSNLAQKRIPVTDRVWRDLSNLKGPGETYDQLLTEMILLKQERNLIAHLEEREKNGHFIDIKDAAEILGIKRSNKSNL